MPLWLALIGSIGLTLTAALWGWLHLSFPVRRKISVSVQPPPQQQQQNPLAMVNQVALQNVSGLVFRRSEFIDAMRQVPRVVLSHMGDILMAEGQLQEPMMRSHGTYQVPDGLALKQITLDRCRRITLDGSAFLHMTMELGLAMTNCQEIKLRNQRLSKLHLRLTDNCQVELENVCCDVVIVEMLGQPSVVRGLHVCQLLHYTADQQGCVLEQLVLRAQARVTRDPRSPISVVLERAPTSPERPTAAAATSLPIFVPGLGLMATHLTAPTPRCYSTRQADESECACTICQVNYANSMTNCQHQAFCTQCLPRVVQHDANRICPLCRAPLSQISSFDAPMQVETHRLSPIPPTTKAPRLTAAGAA
jgi:hypothetical protein